MGERNTISTLAGLLAEVLYRQGSYRESAEFVAICRDLASPDDVASQFLWRRALAKLLAQDRHYEQSDSIIAEAIEVIGASDWLDWQGDGFMDLAEICRLGGRIGDALEALTQASARFTAKGNIVSARRADGLAADLRAPPARTAQDPPQPAVPGCAG